jgi:pimeloyl-ACP methyl ester carboxylesterase
MLHLPSDGRAEQISEAKAGFVFCHPFADEAFRTHREMVVYARHLAEQGYAVLRFDCRGCGDSEGDFESTTLSSHVSDIRRATEIILEKCNIESLGLLGLRFGGALAAAVAAQDPRIDLLVFWAPVVSGASYFQFMIKSQMAHELGNFGKVISTRRGILENLENGRPFDLMAYKISQELYQDLLHFDPWTTVTHTPEHVAIIGISGDRTSARDLETLKEKYPASEFFMIQEKQFWFDKIFQKPSTLYDTTSKWLEQSLS